MSVELLKVAVAVPRLHHGAVRQRGLDAVHLQHAWPGGRSSKRAGVGGPRRGAGRGGAAQRKQMPISPRNTRVGTGGSARARTVWGLGCVRSSAKGTPTRVMSTVVDLACATWDGTPSTSVWWVATSLAMACAGEVGEGREPMQDGRGSAVVATQGGVRRLTAPASSPNQRMAGETQGSAAIGC